MEPFGADRALAVDIGGTKLAAALVDGSGRILARGSSPTEGADGSALFDRLCRVIDGVLVSPEAGRGPGPGPIVCGVGCGGPMEPGGVTVSPLNIAQWRSFPLLAGLEGRYGLPTAIDNDAKALALGEGWIGAARGRSDYLAMVVSTGVGGGIVLDGRLLDGERGNAGHVVVEPDGRACVCGGRGCLEAEASGPSIAAATGRPAAEAGPEVVERTGRLVGRAVASVCALLDLRLAVVAGSVALGFGAPFFAAAQAELDRRARIEFARGAQIRPAGLGADGPLVGAAAVGWRHLGRDVLATRR